jgi:hypothetical protein
MRLFRGTNAEAAKQIAIKTAQIACFDSQSSLKAHIGGLSSALIDWPLPRTRSCGAATSTG